jgi:hypothetical protein
MTWERWGESERVRERERDVGGGVGWGRSVCVCGRGRAMDEIVWLLFICLRKLWVTT